MPGLGSVENNAAQEPVTNDELIKHRSSGEFESIHIVDLNINGSMLMELLRPKSVPLEAEILRLRVSDSES